MAALLLNDFTDGTILKLSQEINSELVVAHVAVFWGDAWTFDPGYPTRKLNRQTMVNILNADPGYSECIWEVVDTWPKREDEESQNKEA